MIGSEQKGKMVKSWVASLLLIFSIALAGCSTGVGGLKQYVDSAAGYRFFYPNGWVPVEVQDASEGVDVVFRDIIERTENLSVIVSRVPKDKTLESLGTPTEVGYRFLKKTNASAPLGRETDLIAAGSYTVDAMPYYLLEYAVKQPDGQRRHNIASVAVSRGKLFTFNISTSEDRWEQVKDYFQKVAQSFTVD